MLLLVVPTIAVLLVASADSAGILYPRTSEVREVLPLDGLWDFALTNDTDVARGHAEKWYLFDLKQTDELDVLFMPVPASYNDLGSQIDLRDHVGPVWYQRKFFVPNSWQDRKVWIRFSSVCRAAQVWINGQFAVDHDIGHLPFQAEISGLVDFGAENTVTVSVDNTLLQTTIPQGSVDQLESGRLKQSYTFDFYNYAGIDRSVVLYTTPETYIDDITVDTSTDGTNGVVNFIVDVEGSDNVSPVVTLVDRSGQAVDSGGDFQGTLFARNASLWWPYLMDPNPGYLYKLQVELLNDSGDLVDKYILPVGIRTVTWDNKSVYVNGKPIYMRGFGRHEDSDIRGKGFDWPLVTRDYNLIRWMGANSYRTSHYPYAEEIMDIADELGIMIIDECPAVNTENFSDELLQNHKKSLSELYQRDKNRPSVIVWSAANEPRTGDSGAEDYYQQIIAYIKDLDKSRPVTVVNNLWPDKEFSGQFLDIASFNIYEAWYSNAGDIDVIIDSVVSTVKRWNELHDIPVLVTEYGADTQEGLHSLPSYIWSEEFQDDFLSKYFEAFDQMRQEGYFMGEMIWNFADFKTAQSITRVGGNKKGVFTRNRQPKAAAHLLRKRYWALAQFLDNADVPDDIEKYVFVAESKDEL